MMPGTPHAAIAGRIAYTFLLNYIVISRPASIKK